MKKTKRKTQQGRRQSEKKENIPGNKIKRQEKKMTKAKVM